MESSEKSIIYAELLPNIGRISLAISLKPPNTDASTRVAVNADGVNVELRHHGEIQTLKLPAKVSLGGTVLPIQKKQGSGILSWALPLCSPVRFDPRQPEVAGDGAPTWSATDLKAGSEISCRQCGNVIVKNGSIAAWKDLPSENWAEMMEFWHCHKPDHPHHHHGHPHNSGSTDTERSPKALGHGDGGKANDASLAARGYGASSITSAQKGIGFIDLTTLLFAESDCADITVGFTHYFHLVCHTIFAQKFLGNIVSHSGYKKVTLPALGNSTACSSILMPKIKLKVFPALRGRRH